MGADILITLLALAGTVWLVLRGESFGRRGLVLLGLGSIAATLALARLGESAQARASLAAEQPGRPLQARSDGYVSSQACQACHPDEHSSWQDSYHSSMTQLATPESVLAPFDGSVLTWGNQYRVERRGDEFWLVTDDERWVLEGPVPEKIERKVVLVTGSHHQQLYWFETEHGRTVGRFPFFYRIEEQRWVPFHSALLIQGRTTPEPGSHWNTACIRCHTTHSQGRLQDMVTMDSRVAEFGIACESCHGPGKEHVERNRNLLRRYSLHFGEEGDPTIVNPARLSAKRSIDVCGQCHSVHAMGSDGRVIEWSERGFPFRPGDDLEDTRFIFDPAHQTGREPSFKHAMSQDPHFLEDHFWSDGVTTLNGREYVGVRNSPCFASGEFSCLSCHDLHQGRDDPRPPEEWADDQLARGMDGNEACLGCHTALRDGLEAHTHHASESPGSLCYNCHMTNTAYGLLKATRSHFIESPKVSTQLASGRPNACTLCHLDQPLAWTAEHLERWYGQPTPPLDDPEYRRTGDGLLLALRGDAGQRALLAWHMGWQPARLAAGEDWMGPILTELLIDPYEAVRVIAHRSITSLPGYSGLQFDYIAGRKARRLAREEARARWHRMDAMDDTARFERLLLDREGQIHQARIKEILATRDDRRVFRAE